MYNENEISSYRQYLRKVIAEKCAKNPRYSLRAFAQQIGLSPSHLSRVINGSSGISISAATKIAAKLGLSSQEIQEFINLVSYENADENAKVLLKSLRNTKDDNLSKRTLDLEMFEIISDWYYFPLYELIKCNSLKATADILAKKLDLSLAEVKAALDRLQRVGLISLGKDRIYHPTENRNIRTSNDIASVAIQNHHRKMLGKAVQALSQPVEEREFQSMQLTFNSKKIKQAQRQIRKFIDQFEKEFRCEKSCEVYQFNLQYFSLTKGFRK
ncbi:MAG: TIGR02147 family protein [Bdellovibrionales bacterium]